MKKWTKEELKKRAKAFIKKWVQFFLNPRLLLCVFIGWMITNGWSYLFVAIGTACGISWMVIAGTAYMGFLWFPFTPEKIVTLLIAIGLMRVLFPRDEKTLGVLRQELAELKESVKRAAEKRRERRELKREARAQRAASSTAEAAEET